MLVKLFRTSSRTVLPLKANDFLLRKVANLYPFGKEDLSFVNRFLSQNHSKEGGLAGTVGADEANPIPYSNLRGAVLKKGLCLQTVSECGRVSS